MRPLAALTDVTYTYPGRHVPSLRDVSLQLQPAEVILVVGASGSGKSTLLRALCGLVPHFHGGTFAGQVTVDGITTRSHGPRDLAEHVGMVFQDPESQAVMVTVEREIAFGLENLGLPDMAISRLVEECLVSLGLSRLRHADLATLSGGELQKVALGAVLAMQPPLLLLDEPTSQLDPVGAEDLLAAVRRLCEDTGSTVVLAEHRVERCLHLATRVLYMEDGRLLQDADPPRFADWAAVHEPELLPPVARLFTPSRLGTTVDALPMTVKEARGLLSRMTTHRPRLAPSAGAEGEETRRERGERPLVSLHALTAGYPPDPPVLQHVDLELWRGQVVALMGENGAGKSTLVRHLNGMAQPLAGSVELAGRNVRDMSVAQAARTCAFLGQNPGAYFVRDTVREELDYSFDALDVQADRRAEIRERLVLDLDLEPLLDRDPRDLSGGERTRAALALVSCGDPEVVVLDEPTRGMDPAHKARLSQLLRDWATRSCCVLLVTHDVEFAARTADRVVLLGAGGVLADGSVRDVLCGSLFFSPQVERLLRRDTPRALTEDDVVWVTD